eukprot:4445687-Prymnesium_polylepis.1
MHGRVRLARPGVDERGARQLYLAARHDRALIVRRPRPVGRRPVLVGEQRQPEQNDDRARVKVSGAVAAPRREPLRVGVRGAVVVGDARGHVQQVLDRDAFDPCTKVATQRRAVEPPKRRVDVL